MSICHSLTTVKEGFVAVNYFRLDEGAAVIQVERPEVRNALDWPAMEAFASSVERAYREPGLPALIVTGTNTAFIAGGDLKAHAASVSVNDGARLSRIMGDALSRLEALPCPTIAAIEGPARGGGAEVALACDLRIMTTNADIGFVQVNLGLTPGWGGGRRLLRLIGYSRSLEFLTLGSVLSAEEALEYGVANRVVPAGTAFSEALRLATEIGEKQIGAVQAIKRLLRVNEDFPIGYAQAFEHNEFPSLWASEAHIRAVNRFLNRR
jgi:enoyl-CoA hydratase